MNTHIVHPKYQKIYKIDNNIDYSKSLGTTHLSEYQVTTGVKMIIPKYYNESHGFAISCFKTKLLFSKAIFVAESEEELKKMFLDIYWLGYDTDIKNREIKRIALFQQ